MKRLLLILLLTSGMLTAIDHAASAQTAYMDSMQSWRKNYVENHELLKKREEQALLRFYPLNPNYRVQCNFERIPDGDWFQLPTSGTRSLMARKYGRLTFRLHDTTMHLFVYQLQFLLAKDETTNDLFVWFTDVTSAAATYGGGRYIDCVIGDIHDGVMILDFTIPPKENDLQVAILASEKNYGKKMH
ncbi:MAG TPA: DUF1684 domain-containing protein [Puia sp.]|jgi:hypothetical protein|nr:DUF1684 domain-containing protein [Puia sp.]